MSGDAGKLEPGGKYNIENQKVNDKNNNDSIISNGNLDDTGIDVNCSSVTQSLNSEDDSYIEAILEQNTKILNKLETLFDKQELLSSSQQQLLKTISAPSKDPNELLLKIILEQNTKIMDKVMILFDKQELLYSNQLQIIESYSALSERLDNVIFKDRYFSTSPTNPDFQHIASQRTLTNKTLPASEVSVTSLGNSEAGTSSRQVTPTISTFFPPKPVQVASLPITVAPHSFISSLSQVPGESADNLPAKYGDSKSAMPVPDNVEKGKEEDTLFENEALVIQTIFGERKEVDVLLKIVKTKHDYTGVHILMWNKANGEICADYCIEKSLKSIKALNWASIYSEFGFCIHISFPTSKIANEFYKIFNDHAPKLSEANFFSSPNYSGKLYSALQEETKRVRGSPFNEKKIEKNTGVMSNAPITQASSPLVSFSEGSMRIEIGSIFSMKAPAEKANDVSKALATPASSPLVSFGEGAIKVEIGSVFDMKTSTDKSAAGMSGIPITEAPSSSISISEGAVKVETESVLNGQILKEKAAERSQASVEASSPIVSVGDGVKKVETGSTVDVQILKETAGVNRISVEPPIVSVSDGVQRNETGSTFNMQTLKKTTEANQAPAKPPTDSVSDTVKKIETGSTFDMQALKRITEKSSETATILNMQTPGNTTEASPAPAKLPILSISDIANSIETGSTFDMQTPKKTAEVSPAPATIIDMQTLRKTTEASPAPAKPLIDSVSDGAKRIDTGSIFNLQTPKKSTEVHPAPAKSLLNSVRDGVFEIRSIFNLQPPKTTEVHPAPPKSPLDSVRDGAKRIETGSTFNMQTPEKTTEANQAPAKPPIDSISDTVKKIEIGSYFDMQALKKTTEVSSEPATILNVQTPRNTTEASPALAKLPIVSDSDTAKRIETESYFNMQALKKTTEVSPAQPTILDMQTPRNTTDTSPVLPTVSVNDTAKRIETGSYYDMQALKKATEVSPVPATILDVQIPKNSTEASPAPAKLPIVSVSDTANRIETGSTFDMQTPKKTAEVSPEQATIFNVQIPRNTTEASPTPAKPQMVSVSGTANRIETASNFDMQALKKTTEVSPIPAMILNVQTPKNTTEASPAPAKPPIASVSDATNRIETGSTFDTQTPKKTAEVSPEPATILDVKTPRKTTEASPAPAKPPMVSDSDTAIKIETGSYYDMQALKKTTEVIPVPATILDVQTSKYITEASPAPAKLPIVSVSDIANIMETGSTFDMQNLKKTGEVSQASAKPSLVSDVSVSDTAKRIETTSTSDILTLKKTAEVSPAPATILDVLTPRKTTEASPAPAKPPIDSVNHGAKRINTGSTFDLQTPKNTTEAHPAPAKSPSNSVRDGARIIETGSIFDMQIPKDRINTISKTPFIQASPPLVSTSNVRNESIQKTALDTFSTYTNFTHNLYQSNHNTYTTNNNLYLYESPRSCIETPVYNREPIYKYEKPKLRTKEDVDFFSGTPVTCLRGIGKVYGGRLEAQGYDTVEKLLKKLSRDGSAAFESWLQNVIGVRRDYRANCMADLLSYRTF